MIVTVTLDRMLIVTESRNATFNSPCTSPLTQTVAQPGSAPIFAYPANARQAAFRVDGGPSWHTIVDIGQRNSSEKPNLRIHMTTNASFLADDGEVERVATTIFRSSRL